MLKAIFLAITLVLLGCGEAPAMTTGTGGTGGTATASTTSPAGGSGGGTTTSSTGTGEPACVEPTPAGYPDPFAGWAGAVDVSAPLTVAFDRAAMGMGSAGVAVKFGPFKCPHDFAGVGVDYFEGGGYEQPDMARVAVLRSAGDLPVSPPFPPTPIKIPSGECAISGEGACGSIVVDNVPFAVVPVTVHVEPGDVIWPTVEIANQKTGITVSAKAAPDLARAAYFAPPGSKAGDAAPWALLAEPPPGVPTFKFAPVIRLIEATK